MKNVLYYAAMGVQLVGFASVGLCLMSGLSQGDYGRMELAQFVAGMILFYFGQLVKKKAAS